MDTLGFWSIVILTVLSLCAFLSEVTNDPCSVWSDRAQECSSDDRQDLNQV